MNAFKGNNKFSEIEQFYIMKNLAFKAWRHLDSMACENDFPYQGDLRMQSKCVKKTVY